MVEWHSRINIHTTNWIVITSINRTFNNINISFTHRINATLFYTILFYSFHRKQHRSTVPRVACAPESLDLVSITTIQCDYNCLRGRLLGCMIDLMKSIAMAGMLYRIIAWAKKLVQYNAIQTLVSLSSGGSSTSSKSINRPKIPGIPRKMPEMLLIRQMNELISYCNNFG